MDEILDYHEIIIEDIKYSKPTAYGQFKTETGFKNCYPKYENKKIIIETPKIKIPFGIENSLKNQKYKITIEVNKKSEFYKFMENIENNAKEYIDSEEFFEEEQVRYSNPSDLFKSGIIKEYKNPKTLKKYPRLITNLKIMFRYGNFETEFYESKNGVINLTESNKIKPGTKAKLLIEFKNIWISKEMCGILWYIKKIIIFQKK